MKIAFFDSGIGGLSVLAEALRRFSGAEFLYFADEDHVPYGTKSRAEIVRLSLDAVGFLVSRGADAVVVACNTATSAAILELRGAFSVPVIGMEPAVKLAADSFGARPTLLIATPLTIAGEKLARLVGRLECETWSLPLPRLVKFAQDLEFDSPAVRAYLSEELAKFELERLSSLVLGCTHFNYFKDVLREILPSHVRIIDGIDGTLNRLASELGGGLKLASIEDLPSRAAKFNAGGGAKFDTNSSAQAGKFYAERRGAGDRQRVRDKSKQGEGVDKSARSEQDAGGGNESYVGKNNAEECGKSGGGSAGDAHSVEQCDEDKCRMSPRAVDANSQLKLYSRGGADLSLEFKPRGEGTGISRVNYPNGNSVEYFYSGRALDAAQLRKVELFLKRLDAMRAID
ncbi:glutamate racemase [uncultured Campylobacter sp.]|uniref:glutamate racemase n=1 Tax=uncultured Campylobacter sp. TaxID=218934 RepID=UPI0026147377|nr:glutamate racemase [uncultured Campylobacter sp.]